MRIALPRALTAIAVAVASWSMSACGSSGPEVGQAGTLPPIRTTTTLAASQTTAQPYFLHYRIKAGETLAIVAQAFDIPVDILIKYNAERLGDNPNKIGIGTEVVIPPQRWIDALPPPTTEPTSDASDSANSAGPAGPTSPTSEQG